MSRPLLSFVCVMGAAATAQAEPKPPASTEIRAPRGAGLTKMPAGVPDKPAPPTWWKRASPCPPGSTLKSKTDATFPRFWCEDDRGRRQGPQTEIDKHGNVTAEAWFLDNQYHGIKRDFYRTNEHTRVTYVRGERHGPARESGEKGPYRKNLRHGRWEIHDGSAFGHYVRGKREGVWLATDRRRGVTRVIARAVYRRGRLNAPVHWWTENGSHLATITVGSLASQWRFFSRGKPTMALRCVEGELESATYTRKQRSLTCHYRDGKLARQVGDASRGVGCPTGHATPDELCRVDVLDPYAAVGAFSTR